MPVKTLQEMARGAQNVAEAKRLENLRAVEELANAKLRQLYPGLRARVYFSSERDIWYVAVPRYGGSSGFELDIDDLRAFPSPELHAKLSLLAP